MLFVSNFSHVLVRRVVITKALSTMLYIFSAVVHIEDTLVIIIIVFEDVRVDECASIELSFLRLNCFTCYLSPWLFDRSMNLRDEDLISSIFELRGEGSTILDSVIECWRKEKRKSLKILSFMRWHIRRREPRTITNNCYNRYFQNLHWVRPRKTATSFFPAVQDPLKMGKSMTRLCVPSKPLYR